MTRLLEKVLTEVYKLPPEKQETIAAVILEELADKRLWDKAFAEVDVFCGFGYTVYMPDL